MPITSSKGLILAFGFLSFVAQAVVQAGERPEDWRCEAHGRSRAQTDGRISVEPSAYCWQGELNWVSYPCAQGHCRALKKFEVAREVESALPNSRGNPDFQLCRLGGGLPRFVEFQTSQGWQPTTICYFESDGSFASLPFWRSSSLRIR